MKIVDRKTFLSMPKGTVYAKIPAEWIVEHLCVKYETTNYNDWYYMSFDWVDAEDSGEAVDRLDEMYADPNKSFPVQDSISRDGLFDENDRFLIYEKADIDFIVSELTQSAQPQKEKTSKYIMKKQTESL